MKRRSVILSSSLACVGLAACGVGVAAEPGGGGASTASSTQALAVRCPGGVPTALSVASTEVLWREFPAEGVQVYACSATGWVFEAPDALLLKPDSDDGEGERVIVGHHYAGPTWEARDRSFVVGTRVASAASPVPGAIPWLLLRASAHGPEGKFSQVTSIQRLETVGGAAPSTGCDATTLGAKARVPYTATYYFYRSAEKGGQACP
jgi:hypothetical protein